MPQIWNVSTQPLVVFVDQPAVFPAEPIRVPEEVAEALVAGADWSYENPRPNPTRAKPSHPRSKKE